MIHANNILKTIYQTSYKFPLETATVLLSVTQKGLDFFSKPGSNLQSPTSVNLPNLKEKNCTIFSGIGMPASLLPYLKSMDTPLSDCNFDRFKIINHQSQIIHVFPSSAYVNPTTPIPPLWTDSKNLEECPTILGEFFCDTEAEFGIKNPYLSETSKMKLVITDKRNQDCKVSKFSRTFLEEGHPLCQKQILVTQENTIVSSYLNSTQLKKPINLKPILDGVVNVLWPIACMNNAGKISTLALEMLDFLPSKNIVGNIGMNVVGYGAISSLLDKFGTAGFIAALTFRGIVTAIQSITVQSVADAVDGMYIA